MESGSPPRSSSSTRPHYAAPQLSAVSQARAVLDSSCRGTGLLELEAMFASAVADVAAVGGVRLSLGHGSGQLSCGGLPRAVRGTPVRCRRTAPVHQSCNEIREQVTLSVCGDLVCGAWRVVTGQDSARNMGCVAAASPHRHVNPFRRGYWIVGFWRW